jgi:hypothetical protein
MTHGEFLLWLGPRLQIAAHAGLAADGVRAIREQLAELREQGALQPFASRLSVLLSSVTTLEGETVARLAAEVRSELAPARERTVAWTTSDEREK